MSRQDHEHVRHGAENMTGHLIGGRSQHWQTKVGYKLLDWPLKAALIA
jgi:hypothetical protein